MLIMIVDDNSDMRRMLRSIVAAMNEGTHEIIECSDGEEAVEQFSQFHPDIVLMDIQLKEMNGFVAAEKIQQQNQNAKIIFVTSHNTTIFRKKADQLHAWGFATKDNLMTLTTLLS